MKPQKLAQLYKIPTDSRGKETTSKAELLQLYEQTGDPVFDSALVIRSLGTVINNYIPNWKPGPDGRCHTTFHYGPPTGQVASRAPNLMNASKHAEVGQGVRKLQTGQEFRRIIKAPPGYVFIEVDFSRHHIHTMAYSAKDETYLKFARLDSHSIFASWMVTDFPDIDLNWSDDQIGQACKELKALPEIKYGIVVTRAPGKELRQKAKAPVLGNQLGLGPRKLYWQNRKYIESEREAKRLQQILADRFPKVEIFKTQIREKAHVQNYLIDEWGTIRYFHEVFTWRFNKKRQDWETKPGSQYNEAVAQQVQGRAHGHLKWVNLGLAELGFLDEFGFLTTIHDANTFCCEEQKADRCIAEVVPAMTQPCTILSNEICPDGLRVNAEVKIGRNWGDYDKEKNPEGLQEVKL